MFSSKRKIDSIYYGSNKKQKKRHESSDDEVVSESEVSDDKRSSSRFKTDKNISRHDNHIYFHCGITTKTIYQLTTLIREAEEKCYLSAFKLNIPPIPIYLHINSFGGSIFAAFSAIDVITSCRVPVYTIVEGATASAGTLISIMGKKRYIRPTAYMLIHQLSSSCWGKMNEIDDEYKNLQELMDKIKQLYKNNSKIPKKELVELLKHDLWLNTEKCLEYGLVDELWTNL